MDGAPRDFAQRDKDKISLGQPEMRHRQIFCLNNRLFRQQNININDARPVQKS